MLNKNFILHLFLIDRIGPKVIQTIIRNQRSDVNPLDLYFFSVADWMYHYGIAQSVAEKIMAGLADKKIFETELNLIEKHAIQYVSIIDDNYPALLREIYMPPPLLYWRGGNFNDDQKHVAIVGSRELNAYGQKVVTAIVPELVTADIAIVSGGARGIDTVAHAETIKNGGKTIAVLGSGLLKEYPVSNKKLFKTIVDTGGQLVSIFPLLCDALPGNFPARNRVISGLSHGCLVAQAAQRSGSLITAHYALEQGRELFAVPGNIDDHLSIGCHELIQQGAKLVTCAQDIIAEMGIALSSMRDVQTTLHDAQESVRCTLSENQKKIIFVCKQASSIDDIVQATGLEMSLVQSELFNMQLEELVEQDFIGMWIALKFF